MPSVLSAQSKYRRQRALNHPKNDANHIRMCWERIQSSTLPLGWSLLQSSCFNPSSVASEMPSMNAKMKTQIILKTGLHLICVMSSKVSLSKALNSNWISPFHCGARHLLTHKQLNEIDYWFLPVSETHVRSEADPSLRWMQTVAL